MEPDFQSQKLGQVLSEKEFETFMQIIFHAYIFESFKDHTQSLVKAEGFLNKIQPDKKFSLNDWDFKLPILSKNLRDILFFSLGPILNLFFKNFGQFFRMDIRTCHFMLNSSAIIYQDFKDKKIEEILSLFHLTGSAKDLAIRHLSKLKTNLTENSNFVGS